ncbi:MAG: putative baseplate assembly protein [Blastocatellia bacterium]
MDDANLICRDERRRQTALDRNFNGIDYVEVDESQTVLCVHLFGEVPDNLSADNVRIEGGRRIRDIQAENVYADKEDDEELGECLRVKVDRAGDFSTYTLRLIATDERGRPTGEPLAGFDPRYASAEFSFKVNCASDLDCKPAEVCPPDEPPAPEIDYLAKDYASFRQLIFDRLALVMPDWRERHIPDIGVALVEVLAYVGDYLSYYQDAVATEAYLDTARLRISVRRHTRLIDYAMHEGCNARTWVSIDTDSNVPLDAGSFYFVTNTEELERLAGKAISEDRFNELNISPAAYEVFEPLIRNGDQAVMLYAANSRMRFYTWGDTECCLPKGARRATLKGRLLTDAPPSRGPGKEAAYPQASEQRNKQAEQSTDSHPVLYLRAGDVLIFEEVKGAKTGNPADADPSHRHAVRLTKVEAGVDPLFEVPVVEVEWSETDALPFALCISAMADAPQCHPIKNVSIALGNCILVDHGRTLAPEDIGEVPATSITGQCECGAAEMTRTPGRFRPLLKQAPLTYSEPLDAARAASLMLAQEPRKALPQIQWLIGWPLADILRARDEAHADDGQVIDDQASSALNNDLPLKIEVDDKGEIHLSIGDAQADAKAEWFWTAQRDLLSSRSDDRHIVVEMDNDGHAQLRFGDGTLGRTPDALTRLAARYRVGNGRAGNVGAETITHLIIRGGALGGARINPRNPLSAVGGTEPESIAEVKRFAPGTIRRDLQRAITADDYARLAERSRKVQRAAAELRWTGSWSEARVAVDPLGSETFDPRLREEIRASLHAYRRIGQDVKVVQAHYVPLEIRLIVCVLPHYQRAHVEAALLDAFSNRRLPNGRLGFFHPDNLTFGGGVYLSRIIATAQAVEGVENVTVEKFQRRFEEAGDEKENGVLPLGRMEVAQLDSDSDFPENGLLTLKVNGGR